LPVSVGRYASAQDGKSLYIIGGFEGKTAAITGRVHRYDAVSDSWRTLAPMPFALADQAAAVYEGRIYVAGGNDDISAVDSFQIYDIASDTWTGGPRVPTPIAGDAIGAYDGNIYVAGGNAGGIPYSTLFIYNIASGSWSEGLPLPAPVNYPGYRQIGKYLYLVGGYGFDPSANSIVSQRLDMETGTWTTGPVWTQARADFALVSDGYKLYAVGGDINGGSFFDPSDQVDELPITGWPGGSWSPSPPNLPSPRQGNGTGFFTTTRLGGEIWSTGGLGFGFVPTDEHLYRVAGPCFTPTPTNTPCTPACTATPTRTRTSTPTRTITATPTLAPCGPGEGYTYEVTTGEIEPGTDDTGNHCGDCTTQITLPFAYQFYDRTFTSASVSSKGVLQFVSDSVEWDNTCGPTAAFNYAIMAHWDDMRTDNEDGLGIYTSLTGSAPNRVFNIEWRTAYYSGGGHAKFEIQLYEGQVRFDLLYGQVDKQGLGATVAVQRGTGSRYTRFECDAGGLKPGSRIIFTEAVCGTPTPTRTRTVTATPTRTPTATPCPMNFSDVTPADYFYEAVRYLYCAGIVSGYADSTFRPFANTTRGQLCKIIVLARGWTDPCPQIGHFTDVPPGSPFFCFVETAFAHGVISGYDDGTFRPGNNITRGQLSKVIQLAHGWLNDLTGGPHFTDVSPGSTFYTFIETSYNHEVITGYADGTFRPGNPATRGQICKIVYNAMVEP
jgi:hypothetical protein